MLNGTQLAILATELQAARYAELLASQDYEAIATVLNDRPMIANPVAQPSVPRTFTWPTFIGLLTVAERLGLYSDYGNLANDLRAALEQNDTVERDALWAAVKTKLLTATVTAVTAAFAESQLDDSWQPTVPDDSIAMTLSLPRVEPRDIQAVVA